MPKPFWSTAILAGLIVGCTVQTAHAAPVAEEIERYCVRCHNARLQTGGLVLETLDPAQPGAHIDVWEQVIRKLRAGVMPPAGAPRPDDATYVSMIAELETALDAHAAATPDPGRTSVHRLNRTEYANAIRDLLALEIDGETLLPGDNSLQGFDNIAEVLTMSPGLLERYLLAAKKISRLALGDPAIRPETTVYSLPYLTLVQDVRMNEDLPFGSRGGTAVRHYFPADGEYEIRLYLQRNALNVGNNVRGLDARNLLDLRLNGERLKRFDIQPALGEMGRGGYVIDRTDEQLRLRITTTAGEHTLGVAFNRDHRYVEGVGMSVLPPASDGYGAGTQTNVNFGRIDSGLDRIEITGPFNAARPTATAPRDRLFTCRPGGPADEACAAEILGTVARRAWRRPVAADELDMLLGFFRTARDEAGAFDDGIERGLVRVLTDPAFLFRVEHDPAGAAPGAPYRLGGLDLASRLSFFLWSSLPDDALIDAAAAGELDDPAAVDAHVGRMLDDPRSDALIDNFFGQWLLLRNVATAQPDPQAFPEFDENLRTAFERESRLLLQHQLRANRPLTELLTADYTFVNQRLARHYGIPGVVGNHFRRMPLPADSGRAGLLGHGSLLTVTSYPDRTSVVLRGKFILENILGTPPPAPPAEVPPLEATEVHGSLRQRMEQHRANPVCATCHAQIDPLGFALENFDGIGKWRAEDSGVAVDASGALPDGTPFDGPSTFRSALLGRVAAYRATLAERLLTYALGRTLSPADMPAVREILRRTAAEGDTWRALIRNVTRSLPFSMRMAAS